MNESDIPNSHTEHEKVIIELVDILRAFTLWIEYPKLSTETGMSKNRIYRRAKIAIDKYHKKP